MQRLLLCWLSAAAVAAVVAVPASNAEPVAGVEVGVAIPISQFRSVGTPGGGVAPFLGYQFGEAVAFTPLIKTQWMFFPAKEQDFTHGNTRTIIGSRSQNLFSVNGGARLSLNDDALEVYVEGTGGYYTDMGGPIRGAGAGFSVGGGFNYEFWKNTALGVFVHRDQADMPASRAHADPENLTFLFAGLSLRHRFAVAPSPPPPPPPPVAKAPPAPPPVKRKIVLRGVHFAFDKAEIREEGKPILDEAASTLKEYGDVKITVNGYTDSMGPEDYNVGLSIRRATAVRDYLEGEGVAADRMEIVGHGETDPVASNDTPEGRAQNRRVELQIVE